jgi:UDP-2-acetamido-3-amino-2,3-dideoxy-glucuronate N-acetyltransferase
MKIHPLSDVQSTRIGIDTIIWQYTIILPDARIGNNCNINAHCFVENDVIIGNDVTVKCGVYLWDGIILEDSVQIGPNVTFTNDKYPRAKQSFVVSRTVVKKGASIGANATIIGGITIGKYALIGAGSVVTKNVPDNALWIGNPAKQAGYVCDCGGKLNRLLICEKCNISYEFEKLGLVHK